MSALIIRDADHLVVGRRYRIITDEPNGEFDVGEFRGYEYVIGPRGGSQEPEFVTELSEGWKDRYPTMIFERGRVEDYYMLEAEEQS